jgi:hypothetical protein
MLAIALSPLRAASPPAPDDVQNAADIPGLLRRIQLEVREIGKYSGEDFLRGDFFLGEGDDDTNKTHHVGIVIEEGTGGVRMSIQVTRLEPSRKDPGVRYGRDPKMVVCRLSASGAEILSSAYALSDLEALLPQIVRAVVDKKNLLKGIKIVFP